MSTSPIGPSSLSASLNAAAAARAAAAADANSDSKSSTSTAKGDSATISPEGQALYQSAQQAGSANGAHHHRHHPKLTDDQANQVGAKIEEKNPALFKQLDEDGDGKISAAELKAGMEKLHQQAHQQGTGSTPPAAPAADAEPSALDTIRQAIKEVLSAGSQTSTPSA